MKKIAKIIKEYNGRKLQTTSLYHRGLNREALSKIWKIMKKKAGLPKYDVIVDDLYNYFDGLADIENIIKVVKDYHIDGIEINGDDNTLYYVKENNINRMDVTYVCNKIGVDKVLHILIANELKNKVG